jgi:hypothetical protein
MTNTILSPSGVQATLLQRLEHNENFRMNVFRGRFRAQIEDDKIKAAEERLRANLDAGLMYVLPIYI